MSTSDPGLWVLAVLSGLAAVASLGAVVEMIRRPFGPDRRPLRRKRAPPRRTFAPTRRHAPRPA